MESLTVIELYRDADIVVKGVMWLLILLSVASWIIIIEKTILLRDVSRKIWAFKRLAKDINGEVDPDSFPGFTALIAESGVRESSDVAGGETRADYRERVERSMRGILSGRLDRLQARVIVLATVGSTSPFIGLFGTVWGIMYSFHQIGQQKTASLATVAPGISEALIATAVGLFVAIPATVGYNLFLGMLGNIETELVNFAGVFLNRVQREITGQPARRHDA
jgi:biopolymer transport protein TolQ